MPYGPMGGGSWRQQPFEICTGYRGRFLLNHVEYGVVRCGVMGAGEEKNGAYPVSVGEKKGACPVVHGHLFSEFYTRQGSQPLLAALAG